jgi:hypothetical protein
MSLAKFEMHEPLTATRGPNPSTALLANWIRTMTTFLSVVEALLPHNGPPSPAERPDCRFALACPVHQPMRGDEAGGSHPSGPAKRLTTGLTPVSRRIAWKLLLHGVNRAPS